MRPVRSTAWVAISLGILAIPGGLFNGGIAFLVAPVIALLLITGGAMMLNRNAVGRMLVLIGAPLAAVTGALAIVFGIARLQRSLDNLPGVIIPAVAVIVAGVLLALTLRSSVSGALAPQLGGAGPYGPPSQPGPFSGPYGPPPGPPGFPQSGPPPMPPEQHRNRPY